jgi:hypothetical protein
MTGHTSCKLLPTPFTNILFSETVSTDPHGTVTLAMVSTTHLVYAPSHSSLDGLRWAPPKAIMEFHTSVSHNISHQAAVEHTQHDTSCGRGTPRR